MKWANLRSNKCPKCSKSLYGVKGDIACTNRKCDFRISEERMNQIVSQRNAKALEDQEEKHD